MAVLLSIAMIVKNESAHLKECLPLFTKFADELCIIDTGSNDDSASIAVRFGAKVRTVPWTDDFSAARNESLKDCAGDWILVLDADERIANEDGKKIRALAKGPNTNCYRFLTRTYTNDAHASGFCPCSPQTLESQGFRGWFPSYKIRLFPNHCGICFDGIVHELVNPSVEEAGLSILDSDIPIHHYPLLRSSEEMERKHRIYLDLAREKVRRDPQNPQAFAELARQCTDMADYGGAAAAYREALRLTSPNAELLKELGGVLYLAHRPDEARQAFELAVKLDPELAEAWRNLGVVLSEDGLWEIALDCFQKAAAADPAWCEGFRYISIALDKIGRLAEAADAAEKAVRAFPWSVEVVNLYREQMARLGRNEEAEKFIASSQFVPKCNLGTSK